MKFATAIGLRAPTLRLLMAFVSALILTACGGGGSPEILCGQALPNALYSTAPATLTIATGAAQTFTVGGGKPCYSTSSSNQNVAKATVSGGTFVISGLSAGSADITVFDAAGSSTRTTVTVASGAPVAAATPFFATAPSAVTLTIGEVASYTLGGGIAPYLQSSSNAGVATASVNGSSLTINGKAAGTAEVTVLDSTGATLKVNVNVGTTTSTALYMTAPSTITSAPGAASSFTIGGGKAPYTVSSSNAGVAVASISGLSTLAISANASGTAQVVVFDSTGASVSTTLTVAAAAPATTALFVAAPSAITMTVAATPQSYAISGGTAPYSVSSSNTSVASASATATSLTISSKAAGTAQVLVFDATGQSVTVNVTVGSGASSAPLFTTAPDAVTLASGAPVSIYAISGGAAPYSASSSNSSVVSATVSNTSLLVTSVAAGSAKVVIRDAVGATVEIAVTVTSTTTTPTPLVVMPNAATASVGDILSFSISGGSGAYSSVTVNNASIASVGATVSGTFAANFNPGSATTFFAKLLNVGTTTVAIVDGLGQTSTLTLTVNTRSSTLGLSPGALQVGEDSRAPITLSIYGGTGPFTALTDDLKLSSVSTDNKSVPPTLTVGLGLNGNRCINPYDSPSPPQLYVANGIYNVMVTVIDSLGASATSTLSIKDNGNGEFDPLCAARVDVSPMDATDVVNKVIPFTVTGGLPNYTITSNDTDIATVSPSVVTSGGTFSATLKKAGKTTVTIKDSVGMTTTVTIIVI